MLELLKIFYKITPKSTLSLIRVLTFNDVPTTLSIFESIFKKRFYYKGCFDKI